MSNEFIHSGVESICIRKPDSTECQVSVRTIFNGIIGAHQIIDKFKRFETEDGVNVFELLGMRNLSAFIGEIFVSSLEKCFDGQFLKNPHQDGYPDLLLLDERGKEILKTFSTRMRDKQPFSGFENGGIEIKATCGSVPSPKILEKKGMEKPIIGDERIDYLISYDWKAHHRDTNNLLGFLWDFIDGIPKIICVFYSDKLEHDDWGKIVQPKEGGGRTTSVSIMGKKGIRKMYDGWLFCNNDPRYISIIDRLNEGDSILTRRENIYLP